MKKITVIFLCIAIVLSAISASGFAYAEESTTTFNTAIDIESQSYSDIKYFSFKNPYKIASSNSRIAVIEQPIDDSSVGALLVFTSEGDFLFSSNMVDPRDVEIIGNTCFVLDYDYSLDATSIYAYNLTTGDFTIVLTEPTVFDIAAGGNYLYTLCGVLTRRIERYTFNGTNLTLDESFSTGSTFSNTTLISASDNYVFGYQTNVGIQSITALSLIDGKKTEITSLPSGGVIEFIYAGNYLYILNTNGCFVGNLSTSPDFKPSLLSNKNLKSSSANLISPLSISVSKSSPTSLLILDGENALAVKSFTLTNDVLLPAYFSIASFSSDEGAFNTPTDVTYSNGKTYFADSKNNRISIRTDSGKNQSFACVDSTNKELTPIVVGVDYFGNIFVATKTKVLKYSSSFKLLDEYTTSDGRTFKDITAMYVSDISEDVYIIDGARICKFVSLDNAFSVAKTSGATSSVLSIDMRNELALIVNDYNISVFDLRDFTKTATIAVGTNSLFKINDVFVDFDGSVYALTQFEGNTKIYKYVLQGTKYILSGLVYFENIEDITFSDISVDFENKVMYLLSSTEHRAYKIYKSGYNSLKVKYFYDIKIPKNIFDKTEDIDATVGTVLEKGNCILYPLNKADELYPVNYAVTRAKKISANEKLVVAGYTEDEKYAYVIYNNAAGFMDASSVSTNFQYEDVPYAYGVALHENVYVYKYPLIAAYNLEPLYAIDTLKKDTPITVINRASDYLSPSGLYWFYISYKNADGKVIHGYIPRYNTVENTEVYDPKVEYGQIDAELLKGYVDVYADLGVTPLGVKLLDKTKIKIIDTSNGDYIFIQEVTDNGDGIVGYVKKENVTFDAQTKSTTTALILIGALILVVAILIVTKVLIKKYKRKNG